MLRRASLRGKHCRLFPQRRERPHPVLGRVGDAGAEAGQVGVVDHAPMSCFSLPNIFASVCFPSRSSRAW